MKISVISLGVKVTGSTNALWFVSIFIFKGNAQVQLEASENKGAEFSLSRVIDTLGDGNQGTLTSGLRTPALKGILGGAHEQRSTALQGCVERGAKETAGRID